MAKKDMDKCDIQEITIPGGDGQDLLVYVVRSKENKDKSGMCGYVWAHGGAGIYGAAVTDNSMMCKLAIDSDVVIFNVDYRIAPENKSPAGAQDCIATLKYVIANAKAYGVE
jgi:acetyl esterase